MRYPRGILCLLLLAVGCDGDGAGAAGTAPTSSAAFTPALQGPPAPKLKLSATSLSYSCAEGGASPPASHVGLSIQHNAPGGVSWTAGVSEPWLVVQPSSGTIQGNSQVDLQVTVNATYQTEAWTGATSTVNAPATGWGTWIGSSMLIWGENLGSTGKFYSPASDAWFGASSTVNAPAGRTLTSAVWTGTEFIIWGGITFWGGDPLNTGGRYNPATDTWTPTSTVNAPSPRFAHRSVWTGTHMIVWGGDSGGFSYKDTGGVYDPATDTWVRATSMVNAPTARGYHAAAWTGTRMMIWGGENPGKFDTGAFYDPVADAWVGEPTTVGAPTARSHLEAIWTGREVIVWGGGSGGPHLDSGGRYNPATNTWTGATTMVNVPEPKASHVMAWTGSRMIVWGGESNGVLSNAGALYRPPVPAKGPNPATITITAPAASNSPQQIQVQLTVTP